MSLPSPFYASFVNENHIHCSSTFTMGTRGLLGHILRSKKIRKGSYNHFDSYPTGLGRDLANFVNSLTDEQIEKMMEMIGKIEW